MFDSSDGSDEMGVCAGSSDQYACRWDMYQHFKKHYEHFDIRRRVSIYLLILQHPLAGTMSGDYVLTATPKISDEKELAI